MQSVRIEMMGLGEKAMRASFLPLSMAFCIASNLHAGSCNDHIRINSIANIQTDGVEVLLRGESMNAGSSFSLGGYTPQTLPSYSVFKLTANQNADFKKNSMSILLAAKASKETIYIQVSYLSPASFQIEKVAEGNGRGLDCQTY